MKLKTLLTSFFLLIAGAATQLNAQTAVTVGSKVTDASNLVSGNAYLIKYTSMTGTPYIYDAGTTTPLQAPSTQNSPTTACAFYFISDGNGAYKLENAYTGNYWPAPTGNQRLYPTTAANAGSWAISISSGTATLTCTNGGTTYGLDRLTPDVVGWSSRKTVEIYEVSAADLSTAATYSAFADKDISVSGTEAASISEGQWYVMKNRGRNGYAFENSGSMKNQGAAPAGSATDNAKFLVRFLNAGSGKYYLQNGLSNYWGAIPQNTAVPVTALGTEKYTIGKINSTDGHFYLTSETNGIVLDCQENGYPVVGWGTTIPTTTGGNSDWAFYPVEFVESWVPAISEVYTINNTNSGRGAMMYNGSSSYVWSSGKSGTFSATDPNCQWVLVPTGTTRQFYLYNVGAGKFAIPSGTASTASWIFSSNAVAVTFITQNDGTKKIKTVTTNTYAAVSNGYNGPIINYNDAGGNFTITKVDGDQSTAATAAFNKLVDNTTAASAVPASGSDGWYVIRIKTHGTYADKYIYPADSEINYNGTYYPLTFDHGVNIRPAIADATYFTRIINEGGKVYWQMPNGKYLYGNNNKFPISTATKSTFSMDYTSGSGFRLWGSSRYAVPYYLGSQYFIGETSSNTNAYYDVYPIDLATAGLTAWQAICDNAPESAQITCSRDDVKGLTAVYKNGYFFLPSDVTPAEGDFALDGANGITIDATAHTISFAYDPNLALVEAGVTVEQGWQTAGRDGEVMLLKVTASPFKAATNVSLTLSLYEDSESNISTLKLYEADSSSPEIYSTGDGAPTKTEVATASISGSTATFDIGNLSAGTHYYWIGATVKSDATLGVVLDAAVTDISYQVEGQTAQDLDLTAIGDPSDRGAMVFNVHSYPFLPRDNGSRVYRIPAMVVADDGSIVVAADKRYQSHTDIGGGHVIDIVVRRSTDGGKTWSEPITIAKGVGATDNNRYGYGDPSLVKGKDGKLYCLFAAGNLGYFYGQKHICMSTSTDNGVTWSSSEENPPVDIFATGAIQNATGVGAAGGYGLYDYFVTSGKGLYTSDGILMYLIPAQTLTADNYTKADGTYWGASSDDYLFYSTDDGATWYFSETPMIVGGDEAKVIEMNDGSLFGSIRKGGARRFNTATYTRNDDGTLSFTYGTQWDNNQLHQDSQNNQDILYYQRETTEGKTDVIFHSITTGNHVNFKLYYSTDQGINWTEFLNVQTKGTRYVTMDKSAEGSLYIFFEDQSLNSAGGFTDYNHYPLNFIEITRDQLVSLIPELEEYNVPDYLKTNVVKNTVFQTGTGCDSYGAFSGTGSGHWARTWTSNASSGMAGLTVSTESGYGFDKATVLGTRVMTLKPSANGATDTYTITAPEGYVISSYTIGGAVYTSGTYCITAADGTTTGNFSSTTEPTNITVNNVNASSTTFTFYGASQSNWCAITNFTITLAKPLGLKVVGNESYATLYLPFDVTTNGATKAYYIETVNNEYAHLTATSNEGTDIPANTAVVLVNEEAEAGTILNMTSGLTSVISESANLLKGTLVPITLDLSDETPNYSLGKKDGNIGFYKFDNNGTTSIKLGANKAYLEVPASSGVKGFTFNFDDPTGIETMVNGQSSMTNEIYNLAGQRLSKPVKGISIINGKKVLK